jgi:hypothetical protein
MKKVLNVSLSSVLVVAMASACAPARRQLNVNKTGPAGAAANKTTNTDPALNPATQAKPFTPSDSSVSNIKTQPKKVIASTILKMNRIESGPTLTADPTERWLETRITLSDNTELTLAARPVIQSGNLVAEVDGSAKLEVKGDSADAAAHCEVKSGDLSKGIENCDRLVMTETLTFQDAKGAERQALLKVKVGHKSNRAVTYEFKAPDESVADESGDFGVGSIDASEALITDIQAVKNNDTANQQIDKLTFMNVRVRGVKGQGPLKLFKAKSTDSDVQVEVDGFPAQAKAGAVTAVSDQAQYTSNTNTVLVAVNVQVDKKLETLTFAIDGTKVASDDDIKAAAANTTIGTDPADNNDNGSDPNNGDASTGDTNKGDTGSGNVNSGDKAGTGNTPAQNKDQKPVAQPQAQPQAPAQQPVIRQQTRTSTSTNHVALSPVDNSGANQVTNLNSQQVNTTGQQQQSATAPTGHIKAAYQETKAKVAEKAAAAKNYVVTSRPYQAAADVGHSMANASKAAVSMAYSVSAKVDSAKAKILADASDRSNKNAQAEKAIADSINPYKDQNPQGQQPNQ